jgi:hypothetical protein
MRQEKKPRNCMEFTGQRDNKRKSRRKRKRKRKRGLVAIYY